MGTRNRGKGRPQPAAACAGIFIPSSFYSSILVQLWTQLLEASCTRARQPLPLPPVLPYTVRCRWIETAVRGRPYDRDNHVTRHTEEQYANPDVADRST